MKILKEPDLSIDAQGTFWIKNGHVDFKGDPEPGPGECYADRYRDWAIAEANRRLARPTQETDPE